MNNQGQWPQGQQNFQGQQQFNQNQGQQFNQNQKRRIHVGRGKPGKQGSYVLGNYTLELASLLDPQWMYLKNKAGNPGLQQAFEQFQQAVQNLKQAIAQGGEQAKYDGPRILISVKNLREPDKIGNTMTVFLSEFVPQNQGQQNFQGQQQFNQGQQFNQPQGQQQFNQGQQFNQPQGQQQFNQGQQFNQPQGQQQFNQGQQFNQPQGQQQFNQGQPQNNQW